LLIVLGIVALLAVLAAAALGSSRSEWKDRAETSEAKLQVAQDEAAEADAEVVPPGGDVEPDTTKPTTPTEPKPDPEEPATEAKITDCDDFGITGEADPDGGAYYSISTRNLDCAAAKELILGRGFDGDGRAEAEGYTCTRLAKVDETTEWRCEQDDVAFRYSFGL
jgi:type II secretory pathway pseudopilin PulG